MNAFGLLHTEEAHNALYHRPAFTIFTLGNNRPHNQVCTATVVANHLVICSLNILDKQISFLKVWQHTLNTLLYVIFTILAFVD